VIIRLEQAEDRDASLDVERQAFESESEVEIVRAVRDENDSFALVADEDGRVVGHVQLSIVTVGDDAVVGLGPIGVIPPRQGHGIGRALVEAALAESASRELPAVVLLGDPDLYRRFGFRPAADFGLRNPFAGDDSHGFVILEEHFMVAPIDERAGQLRGQVRWHPAFGEPVEARGAGF
jgi:putative acetyltransferase